MRDKLGKKIIYIADHEPEENYLLIGLIDQILEPGQ